MNMEAKTTDNSNKGNNNTTKRATGKTLKVKSLMTVSIAALAIAFFLIFIINPFHFKIGFMNKKLEIEKTTNLVTEIKKIAEFTTACFYEELVIQDIKYKYTENKIYKKSDNWYKRQLGLDKQVIGIETDSTEIGKIAIIAKGKIRAGLNFSKLTENDFEIRNDTLFATLPPAEIFDIIINPSDIEFFHRKGNYWDNEGIAELINRGKKMMFDHAMNENILEKANKYGIEKMSNILKTFGYKEAFVSIKAPEIDLPSISIDQPKP